MINQSLEHPLTYQLRRRRMTLEDLEARIGDDQGVLRMWAEQGTDPPLWVVCAVADVLRVLPEHLMGMPPSAAVVARGGVTDPTAGERVAQLIDTVDVERMYLAQLLGSRFPARRGIKPRKAQKRSDIVALAVDVREFVGISRWGAVRDLASVADELGIGTISARLPGAPDGLTFLFSDGTPGVFVNVAAVAERARFTLAHEIGHVLLGHLGGGRSIVDLRVDPHDPAREESAANIFAAHLLLPEPVAVSAPEPERLSAAYGLSLEAASYQVAKCLEWGQPSGQEALFGVEPVEIDNSGWEELHPSLPHDLLEAYRTAVNDRLMDPDRPVTIDRILSAANTA